MLVFSIVGGHNAALRKEAAGMPRERAERNIAWTRGAEVPALDPGDWRVDHLCRLMRYADYNNRNAEFGWTIAEVAVADLDEPGEGAERVLRPVSFATLGQTGCT